MHERGKSDRPVVPKKSANKDGAIQRSRVGGVDGGKGPGQGQFDPAKQNPGSAPDMDLQHALDRIRAAACSDKKMRFTTLWHHVYDRERLRAIFGRMKPKAAAGVDGVTWATYSEDLENHLDDLSGRLQRGAYRAKPVKRVYIPKTDGRKRPIGIPTLEDKLVQSAAAEVLSAVYETDFKGFSYGFRPRRGAHEALDALSVGLTHRKVNWVLDADIRGFFDAIDHAWMMKFIEHRIADQRVVRHVKKWLNAGVLEDGRKHRPEQGTPQGGSISPLLANIYLHYVFDLWADQWRSRETRGDVIIVRYADDFVMGFEHKHEAERFVADLRERLAKFGLELHPDKTRLIEFGRDADRNRRDRGDGKPETFNFLGFTHICSVTRRGWFTVRRQTDARRRRAKLRELKEQLRRRMHESIGDVGRWLRRVVQGHFAYYAVPLNSKALAQFRFALVGLWHKTLCRRSQRASVPVERMKRIADRWLPKPRIIHPYPSQRLRLVTTRGRSPVR
jgi:group II intron reverse transcriptase/maturase